MKKISGAEAVVIIFLLFFIVGWTIGDFWVLSTTDEKEIEEADDFAIFVIFLFMVIPPIWAGGLISYILGRDD
jgi:hypothetical protein